MKKIIITLIGGLLTISGCMFKTEEAKPASFQNEVKIPLNEQEPQNVEEDQIKRLYFKDLVNEESAVDSILNTPVDYDYSEFEMSVRDNNFLSVTTKTFHSINNKDVDVDFYYRPAFAKVDHPNVGLGILLYQAIKYKLAYPEEENDISISSFHFSIIAGINLLPSSPLYGTMKNMPDQEIDRDGYVRISYLTVLAAKLGMHVDIITQLSGYSDYGQEIEPSDYYNAVLNESCLAKAGLSEHKVSDYLKYKTCEWVSYGGKSASDMFHVKTLAVKHYLDNKGQKRDYGTFFSSSNLDGVNYDGSFGHKGSQTGQIITNHEYIYLTTRNFLRYASNFCGQDDSYAFRLNYINKTKEQRNVISTSGYESIKNEMLIYLGSENDKVFELYFTPFDTNPSEWDDLNPLCKYIDKLYQSEDHISFTLNNVKNSIGYDFFTIMFSKINRAFFRDRGYLENIKNRLIVRAEIDESVFENLIVGKHLGIKDYGGLNQRHEKDISLEYTEDGERVATLLLNSSNLHRGAFWYQTNQFLVINETAETGFELYNTFISCLYRL